MSYTKQARRRDFVGVIIGSSTSFRRSSIISRSYDGYKLRMSSRRDPAYFRSATEARFFKRSFRSMSLTPANVPLAGPLSFIPGLAPRPGVFGTWGSHWGVYLGVGGQAPNTDVYVIDGYLNPVAPPLIYPPNW